MAQQKTSSKKRKESPSAAAKKDDQQNLTKNQRKQEQRKKRKHGDVVLEAKKIWNQLRLKTNTKEEVKDMTTKLVGLLEGKVHEIALQHDASRVVQAALQFGTVEERRKVLKELTNASLLELAKNQYAHFVVLKSIKYCNNDPECVKMIVKAMKGHIPKLAIHATGSRIVEVLFETFPHKSTAVLRQEFYGPHFALFATDEGATLTAFLEKTPDKKELTLAFIKNILEKGIEKSLFGYQYYQDLFAEYITNADSNDIRQIAPSVVDHSVHLLSSKAGTKVVAACAAYGTAKERKRILKSLKGFTKSALLHKDAYLAVLRLVQVTDDTVSTQKNVFNELLTESEKEGEDEEETTPPLVEVALHDQACKLFLMLLAADEASWKKVFDPYELELMDPNPKVMENGEQVPTRKKDHERHRQELLQHLQKPLLDLCQTNAKKLLFSLSGSLLIREVYNTWHPKDLIEAVVDVCESELDISNDDREEGVLSLFEDRVGHLAIKNLILCDVEVENGKGGLAKAFFDKLKDRLMEVAQSNRGAFVVAALCKVPGVRAEALKKLKKNTAKLKQLADESKASAGFEALLKEIEG